MPCLTISGGGSFRPSGTVRSTSELSRPSSGGRLVKPVAARYRLRRDSSLADLRHVQARRQLIIPRAGGGSTRAVSWPIPLRERREAVVAELEASEIPESEDGWWHDRQIVHVEMEFLCMRVESVRSPAAGPPVGCRRGPADVRPWRSPIAADAGTSIGCSWRSSCRGIGAGGIPPPGAPPPSRCRGELRWVNDPSWRTALRQAS